MYSIHLTTKAKRELSKLPFETKEMVLKKIYSLSENPFRNIKRLQGSRLWRLRINDYRAVLDIVIKRNNIIVLRIGHRKGVYKK